MVKTVKKNYYYIGKTLGLVIITENRVYSDF